MSWQVKVIDNVAVKFHTVVVHTFTVSDVDDPDIYAAGPIFDWERSEAGQWVMKNATEKPSWHRQVDYQIYGHRYAIKATLKEQDYLVWALKFKE